MQSKYGGFSLIELLISMGLVSVLGMGIATFLRSQQLTVSSLKHDIVMHQIAKNLEEAAGRPDVLAFSAMRGRGSGSAEMKACLGLGKGAPCRLVQAKNQKAIELILPFQQSKENESLRLEKNTVAGTEEYPVRYTLDGQRCKDTDASSSACVIQAYAYFWATCPADLSGAHGGVDTTPGSVEFAAQCTQADAIHVRVHVVHEPSGVSTQARYKLPSIPADSVFYENVASKVMSATGAISTATSLIPVSASTDFSCPIHYTLTQVLDGKPKCECLYPFKELVSDFITVCTSHEQKCGFQERYRGMDANGTIICQPITCNQQELGSACGVGGWIQKVIYTECKADMCRLGQTGGGCSAPITCTGSIVCCYDTTHS